MRAMVARIPANEFEPPMSEGLIDDLKKQIADGQAIAIIGAGVSIGATGRAEAASWDGLLKLGIAHCQEFGHPRPAAGWGDNLRKLLIQGEYFLVAHAIEDKLGAPRGGEWISWLRATVGALRAVDNDRHKAVLNALSDLGIPIATTNYDDLLSTATGHPPITWRDRSRVERVLRGDEDCILQLHGHWQEPESVILGVRSYATVMGDEHAQEVLRAIRMKHTLVFIGCGGTLSDPNFGRLLEWTRPVFAGSEYRHFRLCRSSEREELERQHPPEERIFPLPFGEKHEDLATFLRDLAPSRGSKTSAKDSPSVDVASLPPKPRCIARRRGRDPRRCTSRGRAGASARFARHRQEHGLSAGPA